MYDEKRKAVYEHVYESYYGEGQGIYRTSLPNLSNDIGGLNHFRFA